MKLIGQKPVTAPERVRERSTEKKIKVEKDTAREEK